MSHPHRHTQRGFTLLEMVLGIALAGVVVSLAFVTFIGLRRSMERVHTTLDREVRREQAWSFLERELLSATCGDPAIEEAYRSCLTSDQLKVLAPPPPCFRLGKERVGSKEVSRLDFVSLAQYSLPELGRRGAAMELSLWAETQILDGGLEVLTIRHLTDSQPDGLFPNRESTLFGNADDLKGDILWEEILEFRIECLNAQGIWVEELTIGGEQPTATELPRAIRFELTFLEGGLNNPDATPVQLNAEGDQAMPLKLVRTVVLPGEVLMLNVSATP